MTGLPIAAAADELGLSADIFIGASSGAVAGSFYTQGFTVEEMIDWFRPLWRRHEGNGPLKGRYFMGLPTLKQLANPGWLGSGLLSIDRFEGFLRERLPVDNFRDLDRKLFVTACDVDGRGREVFGPGFRDDVPISSAVTASCCVPLLFRPHKIGDRYYFDGEIVRTLSIDLAVEAGADVVVVSNVYRPHITTTDRSLVHGGLPAMGRQALNIILSEKEKRGIDLINRLYPHISVLSVSPDLGRFSFTSRVNGRRLLTRGYREGLRVLAAAKKRGVFDTAPNVHTIGKA